MQALTSSMPMFCPTSTKSQPLRGIIHQCLAVPVLTPYFKIIYVCWNVLFHLRYSPLAFFYGGGEFKFFRFNTYTHTHTFVFQFLNTTVPIILGEYNPRSLVDARNHRQYQILQILCFSYTYIPMINFIRRSKLTIIIKQNNYKNIL